MKIVKLLFGEKLQTTNPLLLRRFKMDEDIKLNLELQDRLPLNTYTVYVLGRDNFEYVKSLGLNAKLVDDKPFIYDITKYCYRNKLFLLENVLNELRGDSVLVLDWDCLPSKSFKFDYFTNNFKPSGVISANLMVYTKPKCGWRAVDSRKVPNGGFLFVKNYDVIKAIIEHWEYLKNLGYESQNDEPAIMHYLDDLHGGWIGADKYKELYEPSSFCSLTHKGLWTDRLAIFQHYVQSRVRVRDIRRFS